MLPLALTGEASVVFRGFSDVTRQDFEKSTAALTEAFAPSPRLSWVSFSSRLLAPGEGVDVFMADLKRSAAVICGNGGNWEAFVAQAFINGLPEEAMRSVEAEALSKMLDLETLVQLARVHVKIKT